MLAEAGPAPLRLPFWVDLALLAAAAAAPGAYQGGCRRICQLPAMSGLFSSVAPVFLATQLHEQSPALAGAVVFALFISSAAGQVVVSRVPDHLGLPAGCAGVIAGAILTAVGVGLLSQVTSLRAAAFALTALVVALTAASLLSLARTGARGRS